MTDHHISGFWNSKSEFYSEINVTFRFSGTHAPNRERCLNPNFSVIQIWLTFPQSDSSTVRQAGGQTDKQAGRQSQSVWVLQRVSRHRCNDNLCSAGGAVTLETSWEQEEETEPHLRVRAASWAHWAEVSVTLDCWKFWKGCPLSP